MAGLGESFATNLGLNYRRLVWQGLVVVAVATSAVVVTAGSLPFVGLIVPNVVRLVLGDNVHTGQTGLKQAVGGFSPLA